MRPARPLDHRHSPHLSRHLFHCGQPFAISRSLRASPSRSKGGYRAKLDLSSERPRHPAPPCDTFRTRHAPLRSRRTTQRKRHPRGDRIPLRTSRGAAAKPCTSRASQAPAWPRLSLRRIPPLAAQSISVHLTPQPALRARSRERRNRAPRQVHPLATASPRRTRLAHLRTRRPVLDPDPGSRPSRPGKHAAERSSIHSCPDLHGIWLPLGCRSRWQRERRRPHSSSPSRSRKRNRRHRRRRTAHPPRVTRILRRPTRPVGFHPVEISVKGVRFASLLQTLHLKALAAQN